jgi:hypothetical protein
VPKPAPMPTLAPTPTPTPTPVTSDPTVRTVLDPPKLASYFKDGGYTTLRFLLPTKWEAPGVQYVARYENSGKRFCNWWAEPSQVQGQYGVCSGRTPIALKGKRVQLYLVATSTLGSVESAPFWVRFR